MLPDKAVEEMAKFYHNQLRIIQTLPQSTSRVAIYLMLGALPLKALYHQQMMQHYGAICLLPEKNKLAQLARRQLTAGDVSPNSWFEEIKRVADIYDIDVCTNMLNPVNTTRWTTHTSKLIAEYHNTTMQNKAYSMAPLSGSYGQTNGRANRGRAEHILHGRSAEAHHTGWQGPQYE